MGKSKKKHSKSNSSVSLKKKRKSSEKKIRTDISAILLRIYPDKNQQDFIYKTGGSSRFIYNKLLNWHDEVQEEYIKEHPEYNSSYTYLIPTKEFGKKLTELRHDESCSFLLESHSKFSQQTMNDLIDAFTNHVKYPETFDYPVHKKKKSQRYSFRIPKDAIPGGQTLAGIDCVDGNTISLCSSLKNINFKCSRRDEKWLNKMQKHIYSITVSATPDGKFYGSVLIDARPVEVKEADTICSIDYGLIDYMSTHCERIEIDDDGFVSLTGEESSYKKYPKLKDFKEPNQKKKAFEKDRESRLEHLYKKIAHKQKILSRTEYDKESHTTQRNRQKKKNFDKDAYLASKRPERYASYLEKRATTKPFKHKKKRTKKQKVVNPNNLPVEKPWRKSSNRHEKARKAVAKDFATVANIRKNYIQKTTTDIVRNNKMIGTETLRVDNMVKNHKLAKSIESAGWGTTAQVFAWKCARYGRIYSRIDTFEASSKVCHVCGHRFEDLDLSVRKMTCPECGTELDRDYNAADVICVKSVKKYNEERYEELYGVPLEQNDTSSKQQMSETSIKNELPLSSGRRDGEMPSAGAADFSSRA